MHLNDILTRVLSFFDILPNISTGASAGIGEACAKEFAKEGSNLVNMIYTDPPKKHSFSYGVADLYTSSLIDFSSKTFREA